jgi:hypothetical protein
MQIRFPAVVVTALLLAPSALTGCSSSAATGTVIHTPALKTNGGRATARTMVQASIIATETSNGLAVPGGLTPASAIRTMRNVIHRRGILASGSSTGACSNGTKQSQTTDGSGNTTTTTDLYYDTACTTLENEEIVKVQPPAGSVNNASGTLTTYDKTGTVTSSHVLTLTSTLDAGVETITLTDNAAPTTGGTAIDSLGATCSGQPGAVAMTCSAAHYGTTNSTTTGESLADTTKAGTSGGSSETTSSISFFLGTLGVAQTEGTWGITNATAFNSGSGTFDFTSAGTTGSGTLTMTDVLYTYAETGTLSSTGLTLTIVENPNTAVTTVTPIATATVDAGGNGSLTYADGVVEPIWGGLIGV